MASPSGSGMAKINLRTPSCNEILPRLYLGDISTATNKEEITRLGITDMITVEIKPLPSTELAECVKRYLYINAMDHSKQDILSHFSTSNEFIETALKVPTNKVFVHCVAGISRSASLVIAYVMKTRSMKYAEAYALVSEKRRIVNPNEGFVKQLMLYCKMCYTIDIGNLDYRRTILEGFVFEFRLLALDYYKVPSKEPPAGINGRMLPRQPAIIRMPPGHKDPAAKNNIGILFDQYFNKLYLQQVSKYRNIYDNKSVYKCKGCRATVFFPISIIENKLEDIQPPPLIIRECQSIFIEPQPWMTKKVLESEGILECYKCRRKLGRFDWGACHFCSCDFHYSHTDLHLFKISRRRVELGDAYH